MLIRGDRTVSIQGGSTVNDSILNFARSSSAIESGFIAAGYTVSVIAVLQSLFIVATWIAFGA